MNRTSRLQFAFLLLCAGALSPVYLFKTEATPWLAITGISLSGLAYLYLAFDIYKEEKLKLSLGYLLGTSLLIRFAALPTPIFMDGDLYRAIWDGWLQQQSMNPYAHLPSSEQLSLLHSSTLFQLLTNSGAFTSFNPMQEVLLRITGILYDYFGLGTTILIQKGISTLLDLAVIYSLWHAAKEFNRPKAYILLFAWNPLLILFVTGQGLFLQLATLLFIWTCIQWKQYHSTNLGLMWGGWMLTSPLGWILWPLSWKKIGLKWLWLPLVTVIIWWVPFLMSADPIHFLIGTMYEWVQPNANLSAGFAISTLVTPINTLWTYAFAALVWIGGFILAVILRIQGKGSQTSSYRDLAYYTWLFALGLWLLTPDIEPSIWMMLIVSSLFAERMRFFTAVLSVIALLNLWFMTGGGYAPAIAAVASFGILVGLGFFAKQSTAGTFLRA